MSLRSALAICKNKTCHCAQLAIRKDTKCHCAQLAIRNACHCAQLAIRKDTKCHCEERSDEAIQKGFMLVVFTNRPNFIYPSGLPRRFTPRSDAKLVVSLTIQNTFTPIPPHLPSTYVFKSDFHLDFFMLYLFYVNGRR